MCMFLLEVANLNPKGSQHGFQNHLLVNGSYLSHPHLKLNGVQSVVNLPSIALRITAAIYLDISY